MHCALCTVQCAVCTVQCATVQCALCIVQCATVHCNDCQPVGGSGLRLSFVVYMYIAIIYHMCNSALQLALVHLI